MRPRTGSIDEHAVAPPHRVDINASPLLLTVPEAARRLMLGREKTYQLVLRGEIASVTIGRLRRIPLHALEAYVARITASQNPDHADIGGIDRVERVDRLERASSGTTHSEGREWDGTATSSRRGDYRQAR